MTYFSLMFLIVVLARDMDCCSSFPKFSDSDMYIILNSFPNFSSGKPSPFSSMILRSSLSYQSHAGGIREAKDIFSFFRIILTPEVMCISVLNFPKISSPILLVFIRI